MPRLMAIATVFTIMLISISNAAPTTAGAPPPSDSFQLKDGDRVVFLGDSLTATRLYTDIVELYTLLNYPDRRIEFFNAGIGGDTASGGAKRLQDTVLIYKPTVVTVCFGINDIGWGMLATPERIQAYYDGMKAIIEGCQKAGARVIVLGPCATALPKTEGPKDTLKEMSAKVRAMADAMGAQSIDLYDQFRALQRKIRDAGKEQSATTHAGDGVHLAPAGNFIFAYILLKGLGAPETVSDLELAATPRPTVKSTYRCAASELGFSSDTLRFVRKDEGWPLHLGGYAYQLAEFIPAHQTLCRYGLKITGLKPDASYEIVVNGSTPPLAQYTGAQMAQGVNLTPALPPIFGPTPPWVHQSIAAEDLYKARTDTIAGKESLKRVGPEGDTTLQSLQARLQDRIDEIPKLLRELAPTKPLHFEVREVSGAVTKK